MADHIKQAVKELLEMASPKLPDGMKKKRDDSWASTHHIEIGGKHVATIIGHKTDKWTRYHKGQLRGYSSQYGKHYEIHSKKPEWDPVKQKQNDHIHPDHSVEVEHPVYGEGEHKYEVVGHTKKMHPHVHGTMEGAIEAIHAAHSLKNKFGSMTQEQRWTKAAEGHDAIRAHRDQAHSHRTAIQALKSVGHHDLADQVQSRLDTHLAAKPHIDEHDLKALAHDAHDHQGNSYSSVPLTDHQKLARRALGHQH